MITLKSFGVPGFLTVALSSLSLSFLSPLGDAKAQVTLPAIPRTGANMGTIEPPAGRLFGYKSDYATDPVKWAKERPRNGAPAAIADLGEIILNGREYSHVYRQADCPVGYTIVAPTVTVLERNWDRFQRSFRILGNTANVAISPRVLNNRENAITPKARWIKRVGFSADFSVWQATVAEVKEERLISTHDLSTATEGPYRDSDRSMVAAKVVNMAPPNQPPLFYIEWDPDVIVPICTRNAACGDGMGGGGDGFAGTPCPTPTVTPTPESAVCGNGVVEGDEGCDDGDDNGVYGCNEYCIPNGCGNGYTEHGLGEQCDDGNTSDGDGCDSACNTEPSPICGDEVVDSPETCDDGNWDDGDGCASDCTLEPTPTPAPSPTPTETPEPDPSATPTVAPTETPAETPTPGLPPK